MDVKIYTKPIAEADADTIIVYLFEGKKDFDNATGAIDTALDGLILDLVDGGDFTGEAEQVSVLYARGAIGARRVILAGLGPRAEFSVDSIRRAVAVGMKKARALKARRVATGLAGIAIGDSLPPGDSAQAVVEGATLGLYTYRGQKTGDTPEDLPEKLEILVETEADRAAAEEGAARGFALAAGGCLARELVNLPPNICTPSYLAQRAQEIAETVGLRCEVLEEKQIRTLKMGAMLGVAQGSDTPPRFIILEHNADRAEELDSIVLVGKGITFDTGGYSIKSRDAMVGMKADMGGGAAVIGAMTGIARLEIPLHVVGLIPAADNMISGHAYRPQEVITASNGKTIEVISTDAEGRLLLADALVYAKRYDPAAVVDIATLTGSCVVALGHVAAGLFSTDNTLRDILLASAESTSEKLWPMPLFPEYKKAIESQTADVKNSGGRDNGVGTSAMFLRQFVDYPVWAHIDMAGMMLDAKDNPYVPSEGGTGYGARLLAEFAHQWDVKKQGQEA